MYDGKNNALLKGAAQQLWYLSSRIKYNDIRFGR